MSTNTWVGLLWTATILFNLAVAQQEFVAQSTEDQLIHAVRSGMLEDARRLLDLGVNPNAATSFGTSALWSACFHGSFEMVELLIEFGAGVNIPNQKGTTPLFVASQNGYLNIVSALIQAGADLNDAANNGASALLTAAQEGNLEIVRMLLNNGADVNVQKAKSGQTALWSAAYNGDIEIVRLLLQFRANVSIADVPSGATPLYVSIRHEHEDIARELLLNGSKANLKLGNGFTPLHLACALANEKSVKLLLKHGASATLVDIKGRSPVDVVGVARLDAPEEVILRIIDLLEQAVISPVESRAQESAGKFDMGSMETQNPSGVSAIGMSAGPARPPAGEASIPILVPILIPILGICIVGVLAVLVTNIRSLQKFVQEENSRYGSGRLLQPMLTHNLAAAPARGGSPRPASAYSSMSFSIPSERSFGEGPSGVQGLGMTVPSVQDHQPTHQRGPSLHSVPMEIVGSSPDVNGTNGAYQMRYLLERSDSSSEENQLGMVFKSASMHVKLSSDENEAEASTSTRNSRLDQGKSFRSVEVQIAGGKTQDMHSIPFQTTSERSSSWTHINPLTIPGAMLPITAPNIPSNVRMHDVPLDMLNSWDENI